ncbi:alkyldihydroxyacetonephosphate synthase-like isoform X2 [Schistocerca gregaria]|nr:alkyldihydroxyacetonephosphate synthase-like isoform X2 [Schistocerca gregaria]
MMGNRYFLSGVELPYLREFAEKELGLKIEDINQGCEYPRNLPKPVVNGDFAEELKQMNVNHTWDGLERLNHSHGHTVQEIWTIRHGSLKKLVDVVVYPRSHQDVERIVMAANRFGVVIIPFGGGTNVSRALECPESEKRMIVSLDMHEMDRIINVDRVNMMARIEAGITGRALNEKLKKVGLMMGHEPDSLEFSTLGGWVATNASGMKKNVYGNIEDIVVSVKFVTCLGTWTQESLIPRRSSGPNTMNLIFGSEGIFGVVTEVIVKVRELPQLIHYGAVIFPKFEQGVKFMHALSSQRHLPASIRLVDPEQFRLGMAMRPAAKSYYETLTDRAKKAYLFNYLNFDPREICMATFVVEGSKGEVVRETRTIHSTATKYGGLKVDSESSRRGYFLTFVIAYLRDLVISASFLAESFETSITWSRTYDLCVRVKQRVVQAAAEAGVKSKLFVSCRVTQTYHIGSCVYFYFGFSCRDLEDPIEKFTYIEHACRTEILDCGGSISHHHGVGKHRKAFIERSVGKIGLSILKELKRTLDPNNVFASGNIFDIDYSETDTASRVISN